jgi:predicted MFS family arabinose efflux permease
MTEILPAARATLLSINFATASLGRALGALLAVPIYAWGIKGNMLVAAALNLLVLLMVFLLNRVLSDREKAS